MLCIPLLWCPYCRGNPTEGVTVWMPVAAVALGLAGLLAVVVTMVMCVWVRRLKTQLQDSARLLSDFTTSKSSSPDVGTYPPPLSLPPLSLSPISLPSLSHLSPMPEYILFLACIIHVSMRDEKEGRKKQARSNKHPRQKQHSTPKAVTFPKKNELPRVHVYTSPAPKGGTELRLGKLHNAAFSVACLVCSYIYLVSCGTLVI